MTVRILIIDDSATARRALRAAIEVEADLEVVGELSSGEGVVELIDRLEPDLVTLDYFLERGVAPNVVADIMARAPRPIVVLTAADAKNQQVVYRSMEAGALEVLAKLPAPNDGRYDEQRRRLVRLVRTLATVPTVTRRSRRERVLPSLARSHPGNGMARRQTASTTLGRSNGETRARAVVIGASTGGPAAVLQLLRALPAPFPVPIAIVQHLLPGFARGYQVWLSDVTRHPTVLCDGASELRAGTVYIAPDEKHLAFRSERIISALEGPPRGPHRPSIDILFESAVEHFGSAVIAAVLTGMGSDGARGLERLHREGATTLAQAPETCAVDAMPRAAIALGAISRVGDPLELAAAIVERCRPHP